MLNQALEAYKYALPDAVTVMNADVGIAMSDPPPVSGKEVERLLAKQCGWRHATDTPLNVTGPLDSNGFSRIFRGNSGMFPCPVAIKQFLWDPSGASPAESARTYFYGLKTMAEIATALDLRATEPYALLESHGIVVTSWIDGPTLEASLFRGSPARRQELIRDAGMWLARLHQGCGPERRLPDIAGMLARLETELAKEAEGTGLARRALSLLRATGRLVGTQPVLWSRHYGDFKPANLIVSKGQLVAIDVELLSTAPVVNDAAHFLNHVQLGFYSPRGLPRWREPSKLIDLFCQGYLDAAGEPLPHLMLRWQRLYNALYMVAQHREWCRSPMAWPAQCALRLLIQKLCKTLSD